MSNTTKGVEAPKKLQLVDSDIDGIEGFELVGSFYSSGNTGSDLGYASSSKSSKSGSVDSFGEREIKGNNFTLETTTRTSSTIESSAVSGESLIALELGKRTFFEDVSAANNSKNSAMTSLQPDSSAAKKSKPSSLGSEIPRCQAEGCNLDLSSAKDYHRKHRVCEDHSKCPKVVIKGVERRFCQQCSRFHGLLEFDQKKRSCRRRLSDHNARRRKPKPEVIQFNSMRMAPSLYEGRNQLSFGFNQVPVIQASQGVWDSPSNSKATPAKPGLFTIMKSDVSDELHSGQNGLQNPGTKLSPISTQFLPSKGTPSGLFQQGFQVSMAQSNMESAPQDVRALSLLSTSSWGSSCDPQPSLFGRSIHANANTNHTALPEPSPAINTVPLSSNNYWQPQHSQQPPVSSTPSSHTSTFQLFKVPNESSFYLY